MASRRSTASKVAKVSAFMYGQQGINICYGDGLINQHEAFDIKDGSFDLLVANPPYGACAASETLPEEERGLHPHRDHQRSRNLQQHRNLFIERAATTAQTALPRSSCRPASCPTAAAPMIRTREILIQYLIDRRHCRIRQHLRQRRAPTPSPVPAPQEDRAGHRRALTASA